MKKIVGLMLVLCFVIGVMYGCSSNPQGYFEDTKWGMSSKEVEETMNNSAIGMGSEEKDDGSSTVLYMRDNIEGIDSGISTVVMYSFKDDRLNNVSLLVNLPSETKFENLIDFYIDRYGKANEADGSIWKWETIESDIEISKPPMKEGADGVAAFIAFSEKQ